MTALEGEPHGVTSNCVNPGYVRTPLVEKQIADQAKVHGIPESEVVEKVMLTESAIKRLVETMRSQILSRGCAGPPPGWSLARRTPWTAAGAPGDVRALPPPTHVN